MKRYEGFLARRAAVVITSDFGRAEVLHERYGVDPVVVLNVPVVGQTYEPDEQFRKDRASRRTLPAHLSGHPRDEPGPARVDRGDARHCPSVGSRSSATARFAMTSRARISADDVLSERVTLFDAVPFKKLMRYTAAADIGVIPLVGSCLSYRLAAPNKLFEYMAVGLPVVATDLEEMRRYMLEERVGTLIAEPVTAESIAAAVLALLEGPESLEEIGARGRQAAIDRYSWTHERPKLVAAYARVPVRARGEAERERG